MRDDLYDDRTPEEMAWDELDRAFPRRKPSVEAGIRGLARRVVALPGLMLLVVVIPVVLLVCAAVLRMLWELV